jgi:hypothetical protein
VCKVDETQKLEQELSRFQKYVAYHADDDRQGRFFIAPPKRKPPREKK